MYYPIGWHKALQLDLEADCEILQIIANSERELCLILTTKSIHLWNTRPSVEIASHKRCLESLEQLGNNRYLAWKIDSSIIVVGTERNQLLFYHLKARAANSNWSSFLLPNYPETNGIYRLKSDSRNLKNILSDDIQKEISRAKISDSKSQPIPAISIQAAGKLDLSAIGISCLTAAEEELLLGGKNGEIYGVLWNGNLDNRFPWSIRDSSRETSIEQCDHYVKDLKFSSVLGGFALVFSSGKVSFLPLSHSDPSNTNDCPSSQEADAGSTSSPPKEIREHISNPCKLIYSNDVSRAICVEINHKNRLIAFGQSDSRVIVCNVSELNSCLVVNHRLEFEQDNRFPFNISNKLGPIACMRYSPDSFVLATSWESGHFALWSLFGSLLFTTHQWYMNSVSDPLDNSLAARFQVTSFCWGQEGNNIWLISNRSRPDNNEKEQPNDETQVSQDTEDRITSKHKENGISAITKSRIQEILVLPIAHSTLPSSPHLTCSSDCIVLLSEDRVYLGPSVPHKAEFDNWFIIDIPQRYLNSNYPIRYATVDRNCTGLAIAGASNFAIHSLVSNRWTFLEEYSDDLTFTVSGDLIWWSGYLIMSCYNLDLEAFEIRAYQVENLSNCVIHPIPMEIVRMSIFENRLLVLYSDGSLAMFMLNLRKKRSNTKPSRQKTQQLTPDAARKDSATSDLDTTNSIIDSSSSSLESTGRPKLIRSDSLMSNFSIRLYNSNNNNNNASKSNTTIDSLHISAIENLVVTNLQANPYCIASIAITRLHFKNDRLDDSILLNECGKLFLLERELPVLPKSGSAPNSEPSSLNYSSGISINNNNNNSNKNNNNNDSEHGDSNNHIVRDSSTRFSINGDSAIGQIKLDGLNLDPDGSGQQTTTRSKVAFKAVSVIATNVEQFWISPEISNSPEMSYFRRSLWLSCAGNAGKSQMQVWLPLLQDKRDAPSDLYVPDRIMLPLKCDIYPLAIRSSSSSLSSFTSSSSSSGNGASNGTIGRLQQPLDNPNEPIEFQHGPDDAIVMGAEGDILYKDNPMFNIFPYSTVKRQCRVYLHRILRELLLKQHLGYYARKIAESCQSLPYFAHCFELLLHEVLEEESTSPAPLPDPMLPQVVEFIKKFPPVYLETVVHCARKSELSMWKHLFHERAVGDPRRLFQECLERNKLDTAASCLLILQSLDKSIVSQKMLSDLIQAARNESKFDYLVEELQNFTLRAELDSSAQTGSGTTSPGS